MPAREQIPHSPRDRWVVVGGIALAWVGWWLIALWPLAGYWDTNPQYSYGWLVPLLALFLAWQRWESRPKPDLPAAWATPLIVASAIFIFPGWLILLPNLGWRLVPWFLVLTAVAGTIGLCARLGGRAWAKHFAFPVCFTLTAVPWPRYPEEPMIQGLMHFVAAATVELMNLAGYPAAQRGNLVEVAAGVLGVNEACSGVRSLQAALMAAFFLGEFYRLKTGARVALVLAGFLSALLTNIGRTTFLSFSAARGGVDSVANWHDPAGYTVLTVCLVMLTLVALWLRRKHSERDVMPTAIPAHLPPARAGFILAGWMALVVAGAEAGLYQPPRPETATWIMAMPDGTSEQPLPKTTLELLSCDRYRATNWRDEFGWHWAILFMQWEPSSDHAVLRSRMHRPEICMPATGLVEAGPHRTLILPAAGFELAFESMHFRSPGGQDAYIFYCPWEIVPGQSGFNAPASDATRLSCLLRVWQRERVLGRQVAEVMITDAPSREAAEAAVENNSAL